jgi:hypothetical protein
MQHSIFAVDDLPYCVWDWDIRSVNLQFIQSIDPGYFEYSAGVHTDNLEGEDKQRAATALRSAYHHGLETLFALICATLQAPDCVVGWLQKYQPSQLRRMVTSINKGNADFLVKLKIDPITWESIADKIIQFRSHDEKRSSETKKLFGTLWERFASDFVDEFSVWEYNSIKHGLRAQAGGFRIEVGREDQYAVSPPPEQMHVVGSAEFGNSFYRAEQIINARNDPNLRIARSSIGWNPEGMAHGLMLLAKSIFNVVSFLKLANGVDAASVHFVRFVDADFFEKPWSEPPGILNFSMNYEIHEKMIQKFTRTQLKAELHKRLSKQTSAAS